MLQGEYDLLFITMHEHIESFHYFLDEFLNTFGQYIAKKTIHKVFSITKINSKLFYRGPTVTTQIRFTNSHQYALDPIDSQILRMLSANSRVKLIDIAKKTHTEKSKVLYRMRRLEKEQLLVTYTMAPNLSKIKYFPMLVFISLKNSSRYAEIIAFFDSHCITRFSYRLIGEFDIMLELYVKNPIELRQFVQQFKEQFQETIIELMLLTVYLDFPLNWFPFRAEAKEPQKLLKNKKP